MKRKNPDWLQDALFYEIYPQSFQDSGRDGIGDIPGIIRRLDHVRSLGCNALWINPWFVSPFQDAGYDVADHCRVAPRYGTPADARRLFAEAKRRGIRVLLDLVPGHTSLAHPWFTSSCQHARNPYTDRYIWTRYWWEGARGLDAIKGYGEREGAYVTNFFYSQPALNYGFARPDPGQPWQQPVTAPGPRGTVEAMKSVMRFWLDRGASGFRVDMAGSLVKHDPEQRETMKIWTGIRAMLDREYPDAVLVSEWSNPERAVTAGFHVDFMLHFGGDIYNSLFRMKDRSFFSRHGRGDITRFLKGYLPHYRNTRELGYISLVSGNHDMDGRLAEGRDPEDLKVCFAFLLTMPGVPFIYYGDEIGMRSVWGLPSKEGGYGRTACRTPMQWDRGKNKGFSAASPAALYLPVDRRPGAPDVASQDGTPGSLLETVRELSRLRHRHPALRADADFTPVWAKTGKYPFAYVRDHGGERVLVVLNPSARKTDLSVQLPAPTGTYRLCGQGVRVEGRRGRYRIRAAEVSYGIFQLV